MEFNEIEIVLRSGDMKKIDELATHILTCNDMNKLKSIAIHANEFIRLTAALPKNEETTYFRKNALQAANLINEIYFGNCICSTYKVRGCDPESLQRTESIVIESEYHDVERHESITKCHCKFCGKNYSVHCVESGHFYEYVWKQCI